MLTFFSEKPQAPKPAPGQTVCVVPTPRTEVAVPAKPKTREISEEGDLPDDILKRAARQLAARGGRKPKKKLEQTPAPEAASVPQNKI